MSILPFLPVCLVLSRLFVCLAVCLSVCLPVCLSLCLSVYLYACLSVCLPACMDGWMDGWMSTYLISHLYLYICDVFCSSGCLVNHTATPSLTRGCPSTRRAFTTSSRLAQANPARKRAAAGRNKKPGGTRAMWVPLSHRCVNRLLRLSFARLVLHFPSWFCFTLLRRMRTTHGSLSGE